LAVVAFFAGVFLVAAFLTSAIGAATSSTSTTTSLSIGTVFLTDFFFTGATNNGVLFLRLFLPYDPRIILPLFVFCHLFPS